MGDDVSSVGDTTQEVVIFWVAAFFPWPVLSLFPINLFPLFNGHLSSTFSLRRVPFLPFTLGIV